MYLFLIFVEVVGVAGFLTGLLSHFISGWIAGSTNIEIYVQIGLLAVSLFLYTLLLDKFFLKIYKDMKLTYKKLSFKEKLTKRAMLLGLTSFHYYALAWLQPKVENLLHYSVLIVFLSFFLGFAIKSLYDEMHKIKLTQEGEKMIYEG
ncbi:hypothetical protein CVD28_04295 [Bacillus sp. M6-12]|uniref:hypothetical protein n=1 Tax=Bacillus sp. M6-12 TaxID=2054166 RepID=UPI000C76C388|nr:hypothetical protein [Bacillus sp. M6-12]PLS19645.1 hypothetical protein CVD28_04295 [Bacillus sp. M6-12]